MHAKLALSFATAALILAAGGFLAVWGRLDDLQGDKSRGRPPGVILPSPSGNDRPDPLESQGALVKLDHLIAVVEEMAEDDYETAVEFAGDLHDIKREVRHLKGTLKQIIQGLGRGPGGVSRFGWALAPKGAPISEELARVYREAASEYGVEVEDGRVIVRGFLNFSPRMDMPIEYFITRYPEANHETLVHLIGNRDIEDLGENPYQALSGLATALYKGLVAAGFRQGVPGHPDMDSDPEDPTWLLATGETVYLAVRYEQGGETNVARATDWIVDPTARAVLPPDCFRFTGGTRGEDPNTGEDVLSAESMGLLVSVYPTYTALVEVALESSRRNDYTYNFSRIPTSEAGKPLYLDVIFSKTPIEPEGEGAKPLARPPAGDTGLVWPEEEGDAAEEEDAPDEGDEANEGEDGA